jgi:GrpB-like predicted nucleotidyltransferase (UPF0157 family)
MHHETIEEKVSRVLRDKVAVVAYDPGWPALFEEEKGFLLQTFPPDLVGRIEHFGSTAVPGLWAKPIVDMLIEVSSLERTKAGIVPVLERLGYDYFWRATHGEDGPPFYAWFIKRNDKGERTHHLHMVEAHFEHWDRLYFRDYLIEHPGDAEHYGELKRRLSTLYSAERIAYTNAKTDFIEGLTRHAKQEMKRAGAVDTTLSMGL